MIRHRISRVPQHASAFISHQPIAVVCGLILLLSAAIVAQVPAPKAVLGFHPTDARTIADWGQISDYFRKLDAASPRVSVREIGTTTLGKPMIAAFISSEANIRNLDQIREVNRRLADPRTIADQAEAYRLIESGKAIVSISCSIHSNEIVASQMSMNLAYELATAEDAETRKILDDTVLILIPSSNPDGVQMVAEWYRNTLGTKSEGTVPPQLYHHYAGHDNNRDWFMLNLKETQAITKLYWQEWFPQIVYDVHQMGQSGPRFVIPPFFDPPNTRIDPTIVREVGLIGYKMAADLQAAGVKGVATNTTFDMWWHGGFRSAPYYHNSIGILSEAASANLMTPVTITREQMQRVRPARGLNSPLERTISQPEPWEGGEWGPSDIAQIEMIASRGLLEMASKFRSRYLRNFYELGRANTTRDRSVPQAFIITAGQPYAEKIARLIDILREQGIEVHRMTRELWVQHERDKREYHEMPLGSFLVFTDQPQRNNILSLFERQTYPDRVNPSGEPDPPYDVAGWTLPLQMGIEAETVWDIRDLKAELPTIRPIENINEARSVMNLPAVPGPFAKFRNPLRDPARVGLYHGSMGSMDEGWTRLVLDNHQIKYELVTDAALRAGAPDVDVLILPSINEAGITRGLSAERFPDEFAGGIGETGVKNLKSFVESGGRLVCFAASCELVIKEFGLPVRNVLGGVPRNQFYNPGSIVKLEVESGHRFARGVPPETAAYFTNSGAFEIAADASVRTVAQYALKDALLSGWMLGEKMINGKAALVETSVGKGQIVLFAFRPQHRGQTYATFPFIFNTLEK